MTNWLRKDALIDVLFVLGVALIIGAAAVQSLVLAVALLGIALILLAVRLRSNS